MEDIIEVMPFACGDDSCEQKWHKRSYWIYDDGKYSVDEYSDGDHDDADEEDLPTYEEVQDAWLEYYRYVAETGLDPIDEFIIKRVRVRQERWEFRFSPSIIGPVVREGRRAGKRYYPNQLPAHVVQYLNMATKGAPRLQDFATSKDFEEAGLTFYFWTVHHVENRIPRDPAKVTQELKRAARKAIADNLKRRSNNA